MTNNVSLSTAQTSNSKRLLTILGHYRAFILLVLLSALSAVCAIHLWRSMLGIDDAAIFMVYGRNVAAGQGAVYTPGGERVEGFSSPLWMLIVAGVSLFTADPRVWLLLISLLLVAGGGAMLWRLADGSQQLAPEGAFLVAWMVSAPAFVLWTSLTLMDVALWSSLLMAGTAIALSNAKPWKLALVVTLLLLTRSEGLLWSLALIIASAMVTALLAGRAAALRKIYLPLLAYSCTLILILVVRLSYFGYPFPNTYYAKVSPDSVYNLQQGIKYLQGFVQNNPIVIVSIATLIVALYMSAPRITTALHRRQNNPKLQWEAQSIALIPIFLVGLFGPVVTGGDHFSLYRFYQPFWPLLALPFVMLVRLLHLPQRFAYIAGATLLIACLVSPYTNWFNHEYAQQFRGEFLIKEEGQHTGEILNALLGEQHPSIGVIAAGGIALSYKGPIIDVMGLNNVAMAHAPGDRHGLKNHAAFNINIFFQQLPDLFLPFNIKQSDLNTYWPNNRDRENGLLRGLLTNSSFNQKYQQVLLTHGSDQILIYVRDDYLPHLRQSGLQISSPPFAQEPDAR